MFLLGCIQCHQLRRLLGLQDTASSGLEEPFPGKKSLPSGLGQERQGPMALRCQGKGAAWGAGCDSCGSNALEGFYRAFREDSKQRNGWKESREMQIWTPYGSTQNHDGGFLFIVSSARRG